MNSDIRLSVGFFDHPKIIKLERQLGLEGVTALLRLWLWAAQNRPSGILSGMDGEDIEIAARWKGEPTAFNGVATRLKLLDTVGEIFQIHDWQDHNTWQRTLKPFQRFPALPHGKDPPGNLQDFGRCRNQRNFKGGLRRCNGRPTTLKPPLNGC